jgi:integrase
MTVSLTKRGRTYYVRYRDAVGNDVKKSAMTDDRKKAEAYRKVVEAALLLQSHVPDAKPARKPAVPAGPWIKWDDFCDLYMASKSLRPKARQSARSRLAMFGREATATTLGKISHHKAIEAVQKRMVDNGLSKWTVKTVIDTVMTAMKWAKREGYIAEVPEITRIKTSKLKAMKGRPLTPKEIQAMLDATESVVGARAAASWVFLLRGYVDSSLRLEELLSMHWTDETHIVPHWPDERRPVLRIPASMQKNDTEDLIPMLPWLSDLLSPVPKADRCGWVFNPQYWTERKGRPSADFVGKVIQRIGKAAGIVTHRTRVARKDKETGETKMVWVDHFASAHDLRRSCAQRMSRAKIDKEVFQAVMRHQSFETTRRHYLEEEAQEMADELWNKCSRDSS